MFVKFYWRLPNQKKCDDYSCFSWNAWCHMCECALPNDGATIPHK